MCEYRHTVRHRGKSPALKRQALELYLEGLGFRSIGRLLNCSHVAVYTSIKAFGEAIDTLRSAAGVALIEMDEWQNLGQKNACWLWVAVDRHAKQLLHGALGARDTATGQQLREAGKIDTIGHKRLRRTRAGKVVLQLKTPYRDGTTHLVMTPLEFLQRLAALVPRPQLHLIRFHGVLTPNAALRSQIVPDRPDPDHGHHRCAWRCPLGFQTGPPKLGPVTQTGA